MRKSFIRRVLLATLMLLAFVSVSAQGQVKVTGVVSGPEGEPLVGASVLQKGTNNGVITDLDGNYAITVPQGAELEFSSIGFESQLIKAVPGRIDVTLAVDNQLLEEVVVVGYGVQRKSDLTGAISSVKSEDMQHRTISNAAQALQGKTAGVQVLSSSAKPGAGQTIRIRGISSNGSSDPLFVVDGRVTSSISGIDPNDIESMEVLKDAASAAIYGAQAGNGVILVTTRKGQGNGKITYDYQFTSQSVARVPKVMNSEEYIDYYTEGGLLSLEGIYQNWDQKTNTDWVKVGMENSIMQRHNLSFSAGGKGSSIYVSLSYLDNNGIVKGDHDVYNRITGMINATWKIKPWLEVGTNNQIEHYKSQSVSEGSEYGGFLLALMQLDPLTKAYYTESELPAHMLDILNDPAKGELLSDGKGNYYGISPFLNENVHPLIQRDNSYNEGRGFNINGTSFVNLTPVKGLTITSRLSYLLNSSQSYGYGNDYYATSQIHQNYMTLSASSYASTYLQWENFANYHYQFKSGHNLNAMVGMSFSASRSFGVSGSKNGSDDDFGVVQDNKLFYYFAYATANAVKDVSGGEESLSRKLSYFGRLNYDYKGTWMVQASLRADAADSSVLPSANRWGFFPAVSAGWVVSNMDFMSGTRNVIDHFKIRASWGQNGSTSSLGGYRYRNVIASSGTYPDGMGDGTNFNYLVGYAPSATGNNELKWETSEQIDLGIDFRFLKNRLTFSADWYNKKTKDLIVSGITPSTVVGNTASPVNAGAVRNTGVEFELGWQDGVGDFRYGIRANLSTVKNQVTYIHETLDAIDGASFHTYGAITRFEQGKPAWYFYGYKFTGIDPETGNPTFEDLDESGDLSAGDKTMIGKGYADVNCGITINLAWKGIDFVAFGTGAFGNDIYCCLNRADYTVNRLKYFTDDRWTPLNTNATNPRANASNMAEYYTSSACVLDGSYFKIKQIQLGYTLPQRITRKFAVDNLRIYASLDDFFTFTSYPGLDPEITGVGSSLGVDKGSYPSSRKVMAGISITF